MLKEMRSFKLDYVAEVELGERKIKRDDSIKDMWMNDIEGFKLIRKKYLIYEE
jgi:hypothetical protein